MKPAIDSSTHIDRQRRLASLSPPASTHSGKARAEKRFHRCPRAFTGIPGRNPAQRHRPGRNTICWSTSTRDRELPPFRRHCDVCNGIGSEITQAAARRWQLDVTRRLVDQCGCSCSGAGKGVPRGIRSAMPENGRESEGWTTCVVLKCG